MVKFQTFMLNHVGVANLETNGGWHGNFKSTSAIQVGHWLPNEEHLIWTTYFFSALKPNEEMDNLFLFSPKGELMLNIKGKRKTKRGSHIFGKKNWITQQLLLQWIAVEPKKKKKTLIQQLLIAEGKGDQQGLIRAKRWTWEFKRRELPLTNGNKPG